MDQRIAMEDGAEPGADAAVSLRDWIERAGVLAAARLADHPFVRPAAALGLSAQARATRLATAATTTLWHACGVATWRDLNLVREHLALLRHQVATLDHGDEEAGERA